jgi:hypothetical protein
LVYAGGEDEFKIGGKEDSDNDDSGSEKDSEEEKKEGDDRMPDLDFHDSDPEE